MNFSLRCAAFAAAAFAILGQPAAASPAAWSNKACQAVAQARLLEWNQARLMRHRMDTLADGSLRPSELIFTENGMFEKVRGIWRTGQALRNQRVAGSIETVMRRMKFTDCGWDGADSIDGQKANIYRYEQDPGMVSRMWISDDTGLPLRVEIQQPAGPDDNPVKIDMRYAYNDDVRLPHDAERRNWERMNWSQDWTRYMASSQPSGSH
ncbi:MAG TPA: hypothetical protein VHC42_07295 [Rhizomicrobium sp.]|nr:hypothetical protein [Rhizomicrobium sp.]